MDKEIVSLLFTWYDKNARVLPWRNTKDPYAVWVSEIMLQQTRVETAIPYYERFLHTLPNVEALAVCPADKLNKLWQGLGYYRRVQNMQKAAQIMLKRYNARLPQKAKELCNLPGIGEYTSGAIASIAYGERVAAVDGNVLRVFARLMGLRDSVQDKKVILTVKGEVNALLPLTRIGDFNQALMELGATVCLPNGAPLCKECPIKAFCAATRDGLTAKIPAKPPKKEKPVQHWTVLLLQCEGKTAIQKRSENSLLASLWQFPMLAGTLAFDECKKSLPFLRNDFVQSVMPTTPCKHIFTHLQWNMTGYLVTLNSLPQNQSYLWATKEEIDQSYSIPSAFKGFMKYFGTSIYRL